MRFFVYCKCKPSHVEQTLVEFFGPFRYLLVRFVRCRGTMDRMRLGELCVEIRVVEKVHIFKNRMFLLQQVESAFQLMVDEFPV